MGDNVQPALSITRPAGRGQVSHSSTRMLRVRPCQEAAASPSRDLSTPPALTFMQPVSQTGGKGSNERRRAGSSGFELLDWSLNMRIHPALLRHEDISIVVRI